MEKTNKKISLIITIVFIVSLFIGVILLTYSKYLKNNNIYEEKNNNKPTIISKDISMNLEQTAGAGDYKTVTQSNWPTEGYKFNRELSRCENGSTVSWYDTKKVIVVSGNLSDKCYVYFDIYQPPLAEYVISQYTGTQGENGIYYHNTGLENGADDNSYRYAGANPNNYVCFGSDETTCPDDNLYRIIGVFDNRVKLIKTKSIGKQSWDTNGRRSWSTSSLNTYLNGTHLTSLGNTWESKIATTTWNVGYGTWENIIYSVPAIAYKYEVKTNSSTKTYDGKIGLIYVSDYGFAAVPEAWTTTLYNYYESVNGSTISSQNWMYIGLDEWTISVDTDESAFFVYSDGHVNYSLVSEVESVRPAFSLASSVKYVSGTGTKSDPIRIN